MVRVKGFKMGALAGLLLFAAAAWAVPAPQGPPFRVSSCPDCRQTVPAVAGLTTGGFLAVWEGPDASGTQSVNGRFFGPTGAPLGNDFSMAQEVTPDRYDGAVTRDKKGNFVVVWSSVADGNSNIVAQRFRPNGTPVGTEFQVNVDDPASPTVPVDFNPAVAPMSDGGFIVAWVSLLPDGVNFHGTTPQVLARRFTAAGTPAGAQVQVSMGLAKGDRPGICVDTSGRPVIVWTTVDAFRPFQSNLSGVSLRRLSAKGVPLGTGETVVAPPAAQSVRPAVSCGNGSTFVVVWHSDAAPAGLQSDILGQRFSNQGRPVGANLVINSA
ncbi:MAG TPA: hypothetical protein VLX28_07225, partial [Thermoanaerobaculia bacterium]|nr:hypothetical protein [Thermoanaerobaculia bacterium]